MNFIKWILVYVYKAPYHFISCKIRGMVITLNESDVRFMAGIIKFFQCCDFYCLKEYMSRINLYSKLWLEILNFDSFINIYIYIYLYRLLLRLYYFDEFCILKIMKLPFSLRPNFGIETLPFLVVIVVPKVC